MIARIRHGVPLRDDDAYLRRADGDVVPAGLLCTPLWDAERIAGAVATFDDATSRKQFEAQLQYLADHDSLTGLHNRRRFEDALHDLCGDEFAVLLPATDEATALEVAEALRSCVNGHTLLAAGHPLRVTASIGVAVGLGSPDDGESLLADADVAMYNAKDAGRNQVAVYRGSRRPPPDGGTADPRYTSRPAAVTGA